MLGASNIPECLYRKNEQYYVIQNLELFEILVTSHTSAQKMQDAPTSLVERSFIWWDHSYSFQFAEFGSSL